MASTLLCLGPVWFLFGRSSANLPLYAPLPSGLLTITKYGYVVFHLYYILANVVKPKTRSSGISYPTINNRRQIHANPTRQDKNLK